MREILERLEHRGLVADLGDAGVQGGFARGFEIDELIDVELPHRRATDTVESVAATLPALDGLALTRPEVLRQRECAGIQQFPIVQRFVVLVVLRRQAQRTGLDPHVDVLGHQNDFAQWVLVAQGVHHTQNLVVRLALWQAARELGVQWLGLEKQQAACRLVAGGGQLEAARHVATLLGRQGIQCAAGLPAIARHFGHALFVAVEFFEHDHRQEDVVFLKAEQAHGVVQQHVGVEHEQAGESRAVRFAGGAAAVAGHRGGAGHLFRRHRCVLARLLDPRLGGLHHGQGDDGRRCLGPGRDGSSLGLGRLAGAALGAAAAGLGCQLGDGGLYPWRGGCDQRGLFQRIDKVKRIVCGFQVVGVGGEQGCAFGGGGWQWHGGRCCSAQDGKTKSRHGDRAAFWAAGGKKRRRS